MFGQVVPGRYIVELAGEPAAVTAARQGSKFAARENGFALRRAAVRQGQTNIRRGVVDHGGTVLESMDTVVNGLIVNIPDARASELLQIPGVVRVQQARRLQLSLDRALPVHKVPDAWAELPNGQGSAGAGIKIGMIDSGIDISNPAFGDTLPPVDGFPKVLAATDQQFTNAKVIVAKNYTTLLPDGGEPDANDHMGHGTGTSMAAAGGTTVSPYGTITGVAPKAYLGNYKVADASGSSSDVIAKAVDDAVADGMDVLNISLGARVFSYSDIVTGSVAIAALEAAALAGVIVTVSAGNDGPSPGTIQDLASAPDAIAVGAIMNDRALAFAITAGGNAPYEAFLGDGADPGTPVTGPLFDVAKLDDTALACSPLPAWSVAGMVVLILRGTCTFESKIDNAAAGGALAAVIYNSATGTPFLTGLQGVGLATLPTLFMGQGDGIDLKSRIAANPGLTATLDFLGATAFPARTDLTDFSSRGPSLGSALKPDLVAVGEELVTATESSDPNGELYDPSGFIDVGGTSYSAPLTAGAAALLKGARPGLTMQQYRSLLINNAVAATSGPGTSATVSQSGGGVLNMLAALRGTVAANPTSLNFGTGPGAIQQTLNLNLTNLGTAGDTYTLSVVPASGPAPALSTNTVQLDAQSSQQVSLALNASGLAAGEYQGTVQVVDTATQAVTTIPYWFAASGSTPAGLTILYQDLFDFARSTAYQAVVFRIMDAAGLPFTGSDAPTADISAGGGVVRSIYRIGDIPGTYAVDIRSGTGTTHLEITIGSVTGSVIIPVF